MARLDRFLPVKEIAQIGAAIGREFSYELVTAVAPMGKDALDGALAQLAESGLAFRRGTPPDAHYTFKHALVQDAAYDSLLKSRRQALHGKIARVIEEKFPTIKDTEPELLARVMKGIAWPRAGRLEESIPRLRGAIEMWNAHGVEISMPYYRAVPAEGLALSGDIEGGLSLIEESLTQIARPGWEERCHLAEILRLKGWMRALQGDLEGAEQNYLASLDWAREQQAKSWELRTSTRLARLWQRQGKCKDAHELLAPIYGWFAEGFDTKDLQEAKVLLEELQS
jgi:hypothetical protein